VSLGYETDRLKRLTGSIDTRLTTAEGEIDTLQNLTQGLDYDAGNSDVSFDLRWDDILGEILPGLTTSAPSVDGYRDSGFLAYHFVHNQDDELNFRFQLSHRWKPSTPIRVHVHFIPCVNPASTQYVVWEYRYAWANYGVEVGALATSWTTGEARSTIATADAFKPTITPLATVAVDANCAESSILMFRLKRLGSSAPVTPGWTDTYTTSKAYGTASANIMLLACDAHYQSEKIGTTEEIPT
jgi:hypothetical protein